MKTGEIQIMMSGQNVGKSSLHETILLDFIAKYEWCIQQGWSENADFWPPYGLDDEWKFNSNDRLTLFSLTWA